MSVDIDGRLFHQRARKALDSIKACGFDIIADSFDAKNGEMNGADCLLIVAGSADENAGYLKTSAIQLWLLGYEFPDTIILFNSDRIHFLTSQKKGNIIETVNRHSGDLVPIEIHRRGKDEKVNQELFARITDNMKGKVGVVPKEKKEGKFVGEWKAALAGKTFDEVDATEGIAGLLSVKDEDDLKNIELACKLTDSVMRDFFVNEFHSIINSGKKVSHEELSAILDASEWCYPPIIQSGGAYDLRPSANCDGKSLHDGTILCSLGVRYRSYCSNLSRTFMINPEKVKEKNYDFLLKLQAYVFSQITDGIACNVVYEKAVEYVQSNRPELIGIEFKERTFQLSAKSTKILKAGMVLNVSLGFQNLENPEAKPSDPRNKISESGLTSKVSRRYSLLLADIIRVTAEAPVVITGFEKNFNDISWEMKDDDEEKAVKKEKPTVRSSAAAKNSAVLKTKLRGEEKEDDLTSEQKRALHQKKLYEQLQKSGLERFADGADPRKALEKATFRKFECYRKETLLPKPVEELRILVDRRNEAVILPIYGIPVPFHISTLKTVVKNEEGDTIFLRFNFVTPGQSIGKKESNQPFEDATATFIRSMTFRSTDVHRFSEIFRDVNDLKKEIQKREAERKEKADLVEQDKLVEVKGKRPLLLREVFARPAVEGKRFAGDLELHSNGLRYQSALRSDLKIDVLFSNIKHLFFQPCDGELIVVLHIRLKNDIMIGRKKTKDVQFYKEVTDASFDETGNRKRRYNHNDEDELASEQEERMRRAQLNKEFKQYAEKIADAARNMIEVDIPFRDLGFQGVPFRQPVLLLPTTDCLVHLVEFPFLVVTIAEVEIAHLERVRFGLKSFDLVFVFKDFTKPVLQINTIPSEQLENVKEWLDSVDVPFTEGPTNLTWPQIMKTVNASPADFFNEGGWSFLQPESDNSDDESEEESEYEQESEDFDEEESESDYDSDAEASGSGYSDDEDSGEESGKDWDELEKEAVKSDRRKEERDVNPKSSSSSKSSKKKRRDDSDESEDERPRKKK
ncbi:FACT complex subunit spt16 [Blyttiomyces sp. JEL0837]|nr:FACT complex subunit spt16 [Blyttiomyces sp. JEL0837]